MAYAVVPAESTTIIRGLVLNRVVPKTLTTGFSGTGPPATPPRIQVDRLQRGARIVARGRGDVLAHGVVSHKNWWSFNGATAATLRLPVLTMVALGGAPPAPGVTVVAPGEAVPPSVVSEVFRIRPVHQKVVRSRPAASKP